MSAAQAVVAVDQRTTSTRVDARRVAAVGITNQRETVVAWDVRTGRPVHRAIVWQDTRTADAMARLAADGREEGVRERTGLPLTAYFSASKIRWLLDEVPEARELSRAGRLRVGTMDAWLVWNLTGGVHGGVHATDVTNASRTLLMALAGVPVSGVLGDQQAAAFGQALFRPGDTKNTYGTGCFLLRHTGTVRPTSDHGLVSTVAFQREGGPLHDALEGSVAVAGSLVQWLRDGLGIISSSAEEEVVQAIEADGPDGDPRRS